MTRTVPAVPQIPAGWPPLPADMTAWITSPLSFLGYKAMFRAQMQAAVALSAAAYTIVGFDTILEDPYGGWNAPGESWHCPAGCSGWYEASFTASTVSQGVTTATTVGGAVWVNGTQYAEVCLSPGVDGNSSSSSGAVLVPLIAADYVQFYIYSTRAVNSETAAGRCPSAELCWISS